MHDATVSNQLLDRLVYNLGQIHLWYKVDEKKFVHKKKMTMKFRKYVRQKPLCTDMASE